MRFTPSTILVATAGIFFSATINAASIPPHLKDVAVTLRAWSTPPLNHLQPFINHSVELDAAGNAIVNLANDNNVLTYVRRARILSIKVI